MKRDEILLPGNYSALPKAILAMPNKILTAATKLVLMALIDRLGQNECCWPSLTTIQKDTGLRRQAVSDSLTTLKALGLITRQQRNYEINIPSGGQDVLLVCCADYLKQHRNSLRCRPRLVCRADHIVCSADHHQSAVQTITSLQCRPELLKITTEFKPPQETTEPTTARSAASAAAAHQGDISPIDIEPQRSSAAMTTLAESLITAMASAGQSPAMPPASIATLITAWWNKGHHLNQAGIQAIAAAKKPIKEAFQPVEDGCGQIIPAWKRWLHEEAAMAASNTDSEPALRAIEAWQKAGLNSVHEPERVARRVSPAVNDLRHSLGGDAGLNELVAAALKYRTAKDFRLDNPACLSFEWLWRYDLVNGERRYHIERLALGDYNWKEKKQVQGLVNCSTSEAREEFDSRF